MQTPEIICLKSNAYYALLDEILEHISTKFSVPQKQWLLTDEALAVQGVFTLDNNETQSNFLIMS